jgi:glycerate kinase
MRVLVIPDKFKGSLSAPQAARAIRAGILDALPRARVTCLPLSDGGEGFVESLAAAAGGSVRMLPTLDPMNRACRARYGTCPDGTAVASIAEASGYWRIKPQDRDPGRWTTEGTGRLLAKIAARGFREIIVGFGGSITNEGGIGLAAPFGFHFLDRHGRPLPLNGESLSRLSRILPPEQKPSVRFIAATDVRNPLYGPQGAAFQFAAQKGATPAQVRQLDKNLQRLADVAGTCLGKSAHLRPGAGAAGGAAYGLMTFLGAKRVSGFDLLAEKAGLENLIRRHDLVITGEGCLDTTSTQGKGPWAIAQLARKQGKPAWALCGISRLPENRMPFQRVGELVAVAPTPQEAQARAAYHLRRLAAACGRSL